ncbi:PHP domain-containing protein [Paraclostridium ghonii]|uniref:PHP domain-containing protein n=1 Tax=Paraclostridium ghonii TaxID=29358 RepID=UPI00202CF882|nr:PHP domain-containing protein [Paeniclostridium ghonii]MCM0166136.1 PHP domain-containing protein [Paeniclostridium ghonii]
MKIIGDYHTHTVYSHGKGSIEDNVKVAIEKNIEKIGISDHGYKHIAYGVKYDNIAKMREEIDKLNEKYKEIEILLGMECNILDDKGNIDVDYKISQMLDYTMAGYHFGSMPASIKSALNHTFNYLKFKGHSKEYNTKAVINAIKNNNIFIVTHPGDKGDVYIEEIAKVALKHNTLLEINSHHGYLNSEQLKKIKNTGVEFVIGSDAHCPNNVGNFDKAIKIAKEADLDFSLIKNIKF